MPSLRERSIVHLNIADFAVAVERLVDPRLKQRPLIIAPGGTSRATVYDMSEEAYASGVRKGMRCAQARRFCRDAAILPPHPDRYERIMGSLIKQALPYSPLIESGESDGHLFVDVTGTSRLWGPSVDVAWRMQRQIKSTLNLNPIWSLAANKLVAKVATRMVKPSGEYIVGAGDEEAFLAPLPLYLFPGLDREDLARLLAFNLTRACHITALSIDTLQAALGRRAYHIYETVRGCDTTPVEPLGHKPPDVRGDHEFGEDTNHPYVLEGALYGLVEHVGRELRRKRLAARRLGITVDYSDGKRRRRQKTLPTATANDFALFENARSVLQATCDRRVRVRHMRLICDRLTFPPAQLELFPANREENKKRAALVNAIDLIRDRYGHEVIQTGRTMMPVLKSVV